ncbi:MAG: ATP-binding protein [Candidatus Thiodiazotropha taylori]|nr:ATP-binding protein [Candidatus Thiodiazotropha taylori]
MTSEERTSTSAAPMRAGGRATEAGMSFQAAVATWFAVHILARQPVGLRFGINNEAIPETIRLETGSDLDDIEIIQSDGGELHIQCKTRATISTSLNSPLNKTIYQLVEWITNTQTNGKLLDLTHDAAILGVRIDAPRNLDHLESGCRAFDLGGDWATTLTQRNKEEQNALRVFEENANNAWKTINGNKPNNRDLVNSANLFHIERFSMDEGDSDWREASQLLGRSLFGGETAGDAPLRDLIGIMRDLIGSGSPANRIGLLRNLRRLGHQDIGAPGYESDVARLKAVTAAELERLAVHTELPLGQGIPIKREISAPLTDSIQTDSLLVVGEPGAGKTGALIHAAQAIAVTGGTIIFLSVDQYPGVAIMADLTSELQLSHSIIDALSAVPGAGPKFLFIDALDAARGGPSEGVFSTLIENAQKYLPDEWNVVASIRTFDLKNGRRFSQAFSGVPADNVYSEAELSAVRHFLIPHLSETDLKLAGSASPELAALLESAQPCLTELLHNVFNLSLAAQLLTNTIDPVTFGTISTQSELIDAYEDFRLNTTQLQRAAGETAAMILKQRRLSVRKVTIRNDQLDAVLQTGILKESGDLVSFAHHILFDHITSRFHLSWDNPKDLLNELSGDTSTALLLAPAIRFAVERLWHIDKNGHPLIWQLATDLFSDSKIDPLLGVATLRVIVENIEDESDIGSLLEHIAENPTKPELETLFKSFSRYAAIEIEAPQTPSPQYMIAWARLAEALISTKVPALIGPTHVLLHALFDHGDLDDNVLLEIFGVAARIMLKQAWAALPAMETTRINAIRFVGKSYASNPAESRALLDPILQEPHFSQYADKEASWLAEQIIPIAQIDPDFTIEIYRTLFTKTITDDATSWLGTNPSRILPLSSNRRQDYEHCHWQLGKSIIKVLEISAEIGTRALIDALIGQSSTKYYTDISTPILVNIGTDTIELRGTPIELTFWNEEEDEGINQDHDLLHNYAQFLRKCNSIDFATSVSAASRQYATPSVWRRIFGIGSNRVDIAGDLLWPLIEHPDFLMTSGISREVAGFITSAWPSRTREERIRFETMTLDNIELSANEGDLHQWHYIMGHILAPIPEDILEMDATRTLRHELETKGLLTQNDEPDLDDIHTYVDYVRDELQRAGIIVTTNPYLEILAASDTLYTHIGQTPTTSSAHKLAGLWKESLELIALIDLHPGLHELVYRSAWGHISNAIERMASSENYSPGLNNLPDLTELFIVLERLSSNQYPAQIESKS